MTTLITEVGRALYGARFTSQMARDLDVSEATVRRWINGEYDVPVEMLLNLRKLVGKRATAINKLSDALRAEYVKQTPEAERTWDR